MFNKKNWLSSLKGIKTLVIVMVLILITFLVSIIILERSLGISQLQSVYKQENRHLQTAFEKEINKTVDLAQYFTVTPISVLPEDFTPEQYTQYYSAIKQISSVSAVSDHIVSVSLRYRDSYINYGEQTNDMDAAIIDNPKVEYKYNKNTQLIYCEQEPEYMYLKYSPKTITAGANEVCIKISLDSLSEHCVQTISDEQANYIVLEDGTVIVSLNYSDIGKRIEHICDVDVSMLKKDITKSSSNYAHLRYTSSANLEKDLYFLTVVSEEYYLSIISKRILVGFLFCLFFFILVSAFILVFYGSFVRPIGRILETIDEEVTEKKEYNRDIMDYIKSNISGLYSKNSNLTEKVSKMFEELKLQQIIACQMQINPHFLSNTLSAINWMAVDKFNDIDNPISNSLSSLSDIFYSSLAADEIIVTIDKEKSDTEKYIEILKIRYGSELNVEWELDEDIEDEYILKTSIQPLIENCASYAFVSSSKEKKISVSIRHEGEGITVSVKDNGIGIEPDKLAELKREINNFETPINKHIGLKNINRRVKLLYGEDYGLNIESALGEYTLCSFSYPKNKK